MVDQVLQALEGKAGGDVVPVIWQAVDAVMLHSSVSDGKSVDAWKKTTTTTTKNYSRFRAGLSCQGISQVSSLTLQKRHGSVLRDRSMTTHLCHSP